MSTVTNTLIEGLNQRMVQARLDTIDMKPFLFGKYFPVKKVTGFNWKTVSNYVSNLNVAADIHTDNGTILRKTRPVFQNNQGDIPHIAISRELTRSEIKDYQTELALASNADATALVQFWGSDIDFCARGVQAELEFLAWNTISNAGVCKITTENNASFANKFDMDYQVDKSQKHATATDWGDKSTADVIGDLTKIMQKAKKKGITPKFAFINLNELYRIASCEQVIKACASVVANAVGIQQTPTLAQINTMLASQAWLNGLQLRVIDTTVTRELINGTIKTDNPFADNTMVLSETEILGSTQYDVLRNNDRNNCILRAERAHTVIKKYGIVEPLTEITIGEADALPVLDSAYRNFYVHTDKKAW